MEGGHHRGEKRPALAPSPVQSCWVIKGKKNESLYLSGAGQESSAAVIKILSSPVKDTYRSSSATRSLFVKENQLNRWGLSFHSSCKRVQGCLLAASKLVWGLPGHPQHVRRGTRDLCVHEGDGSPAAGNTWVAVSAAPGGCGARDDTAAEGPWIPKQGGALLSGLGAGRDLSRSLQAQVPAPALTSLLQCPIPLGASLLSSYSLLDKCSAVAHCGRNSSMHCSPEPELQKALSRLASNDPPALYPSPLLGHRLFPQPTLLLLLPCFCSRQLLCL